MFHIVAVYWYMRVIHLLTSLWYLLQCATFLFSKMVLEILYTNASPKIKSWAECHTIICITNNHDNVGLLIYKCNLVENQHQKNIKIHRSLSLSVYTFWGPNPVQRDISSSVASTILVKHWKVGKLFYMQAVRNLIELST